MAHIILEWGYCHHNDWPETLHCMLKQNVLKHTVSGDLPITWTGRALSAYVLGWTKNFLSLNWISIIGFRFHVVDNILFKMIQNLYNFAGAFDGCCSIEILQELLFVRSFVLSFILSCKFKIVGVYQNLNLGYSLLCNITKPYLKQTKWRWRGSTVKNYFGSNKMYITLTFYNVSWIVFALILTVVI